MSSEEGELPEAEEGELPEQESGEASGFEEQEPDGFEPHHYTTAYRAASVFPPPFDLRGEPSRPPGNARDFGNAGPGATPLRSPERFGATERRSSHHATGMPPPSQPPRDEKSQKEIAERQAALREEREKEELSSSLKELTRYVSVQDAMRSLDTVCKDLKSAIKKLEKLAKKTKKSKTDDIELFPDCFQYSRRIIEGLKSVNVVCGTSGISQTLSMEVAKKLFRTAMNYRHDILSAAQKRELESMVRSSRVLKGLIDDRGKSEKDGSAALNRESSALPDGLSSPREVEAKSRSRSPDTERSGVPKMESTPLSSVKEEEHLHPYQLQEGMQYAPPPPLPPPGSPPGAAHEPQDMQPPPPPPCNMVPSSAPLAPSEDGAAEGMVHSMSTGLKGVGSVGKSSAFKFKIVVESTAADIRKGLPHGPEVDAAASASAAAAAAQPSASPMPTSSAAPPLTDSGRGSQSKRSHHSSSSRGEDPSNSRSSKKARGGEHEDGSAGGGGSRDRVREEDGGRHGGGSSSGRHGDRERDTGRGTSSERHDRHSSHHRGSSGREHGTNNNNTNGSNIGNSNGNTSGDDRYKEPSGRQPGGSSPPPPPHLLSMPIPPPPESPISDDDAGPASTIPDVLPQANGHHPSHNPHSHQHMDHSDHLHSSSHHSHQEQLANGYANNLPGENAPPEEAVKQLLGQGRMTLVLDLDHTLLHTAHFSDLSPEAEAILAQRLAAEAELLPEASAELFRMETLGMWAKLRPGVREFLHQAKDKFEMWVHTSGSSAYAEGLLQLLDPSRALFGTRIIAQGEEAGNGLVAKRLIAGLEGRVSVAIILDDSSAVWPHDQRNLFMVERYVYFPAYRKRFGMEGKSLLEINRDECPERGMLMTASTVLHRLHSMVFTNLNYMSKAPSMPQDAGFPSCDVRHLMGEERRKVLSGVRLVFSRVIPLEQEPRSHALWRLAEQFGASCSTQTSESTSHVIATSRGTEKTFWAVQNGKQVVTPAWLECSCIMWRRASEARFTVPP